MTKVRRYKLTEADGRTAICEIDVLLPGPDEQEHMATAEGCGFKEYEVVYEGVFTIC